MALLEKFANPLMGLLDFHAYFKDQVLYSNDIAVQGFLPELNYEKLVGILLVFIWLTKQRF
jgi:hypothetical protein